MDNDITKILTVILGLAIILLVIFVIIFIVVQIKVHKKNKVQNAKLNEDNKKSKKDEKKGNISGTTSYNKQSIFDFMEFNGVEDNMIVQKNGKRYIMVIECQGINYDLMSQMEKVGVEEGFQQFLNTLRFPIQIYIQTRTINLESSIQGYKAKLKEIESKYNRTIYDYNRMVQSEEYTKQQLDAAFFNLTKQRNLYEYARDIVENTERMSLNRNILNKKYYVILAYMPEEAGSASYDVEELRNMAFSELYTKAQALIRTLSGCSVNGKILDSSELVELLYVAYNRDDFEIFGVDKAIQAGYEDLYSVAPDIFEKKVKVLDEQIKNGAIDLANEAISKVKAKSKAEQLAEEKEKRMDDLISQMAKMILEENQKVIGVDVAKKAVEEITEEDKQKKEGGKQNEKKEKGTTTRGRTKSDK